MTPETLRIVLSALDAALVQQIIKLFGVLMSDPSEAGIDRCLRGLHQAAGAYERLVAESIAPDEI